jgi:proteasome lid subunit RPN8/RPN11
MSEKLFLKRDHWLQMLEDVKSRAQEEACGLVAGNGKTSSAVFPVTNELHSPIRYRMDPQEQLEILIKLEEDDSDLLAIYHSHLGGPSRPSATDIAEALYPGVIHLIWYPAADEWACRGYLIDSSSIEEVEIILGEDDHITAKH